MMLFITLSETTMSADPYFPLEIHDSIVDLLHGEPETIKQCCLVSKSWVPRTRKHLFGTVILGENHRLEIWKKTFPNPANSPAYHTHTLVIGCAHAVATGDAEEGGWIRTFYNVVNLEVWTNYSSSSDWGVSLVPFHNFSPVLKSLILSTSSVPGSQILDFVCSLPLLEDLAVAGSCIGSGWDWAGSQPLTSPVFTGTLEIVLRGGWRASHAGY